MCRWRSKAGCICQRPVYRCAASRDCLRRHLRSEELDDFVPFDDAKSVNSKYVCLFDPAGWKQQYWCECFYRYHLWCVQAQDSAWHRGNKEDFYNRVTSKWLPVMWYMDPPRCWYMPQGGVNGFTLDPSVGEWTLSHPDIKCPDSGKMYSVNHGNFSSMKKEKTISLPARIRIKQTADRTHSGISAVW